MMKVKTRIKAGRIAGNHTQSGVRVKTRVRAGRLSSNHTQA